MRLNVITKISFCALVCSLIFSSCSEPVEVEKGIVIGKVTANAEDTTAGNNLTKEGVHSGAYSFRTDSGNQYSGGIAFNLPDSVVNSPIRVVANFWVKTNNPLKGDGMAISLYDKDAIAFWGNMESVNYGIKQDAWINVVDSITIPADKIKSTGMYFKIFGYNANQKAKMDLDDIEITFKQIKTVLE